MPEEPPDILQFRKWLLYHLVKDWKKVISAPLAFAAIFFLAVVFCWLFIWQIIIPEKDQQLATKQTTIESKQDQIERLKSERDHAETERDRLANENAQLRIYRGQDEFPFKKKAIVLAEQIKEFIKNWKDSDVIGDRDENVQEYIHRFGLRASIMRDDLDQHGLQSDDLDRVMYHFGMNYRDVQIIQSEIERLANKLP